MDAKASTVSFTMHGIGVSSGIAIGHAHLFIGMSTEVDHYEVAPGETLREQRRYDRAVKEVRDELKELADSVRHSAASELAPFVKVHLMLLDDAAFTEVPREIIRERHCNAEWALRQQLDELSAQFDEIEDPYLREREEDVRQVAERVLEALAGTKRRIVAKPPRGEDPPILVARDLSPADVILFRQHPFGAFITDLGGATSHTAIMARSLNMPAIVALHHGRSMIREDELIIVDGTQGVVIVNPDRHVLAEYRLKQNDQSRIEREKLKRLKSAPAATLDGTTVQLFANIELPADVEPVRASGATGVGLFRSEFLFMNRRDQPDEEEQFEAYREVVEGMKGMPVTIRTLDIGADKQLDGQEATTVNPALGLRAIRYCLAEPHIFNTQLRAILRASRYGKVLILIPMISTWAEITQALLAVAAAKEQLKSEGIKFDDYVPVGGMIEVPAAAIALPMFIRKLDFLSVGTNDLIQYTLAIDRADDAVAHLYDPLHPAILNLLAGVIRTAQQHEKPVAVCGEMAGDVDLTRLLLGFGLRNFSMHPAHVLSVKQRVLSTSLPDIAGIVARILKTDEPERLQSLMEKLNWSHLPMNRPHDDAAIRVQSQQATLFALLKSGIPTAGAAEAWKALTEATAKTLGLQRVSIWLLDAERDHLELADLFDLQSGRHTRGATLDARQYPAYFQALRWNRAVVAPDAAEDPRTKEFAEGYLKPLQIVSMLDAGIWRGGEARGVVCLESVRERRAWHADEQQFSGSIADLAASVLDNEALRAARTRLEESEALFSRALRSSPDWISVVRMDDGVILHVNDAFERESGYRASEVIGRATIDVGLWANPEQRKAWIGRVRADGLVREFEVEFRLKSGETRTFLLSGHRVEVAGDACVVTSSRDISELKRRERLVRDIARGVGAAIGESFFRSLVDHLAGALDADYAFVGELGPGGDTVRSIAVSRKGTAAPEFEYALSGSPCETILAKGASAYPIGVAAQFPRDKALAEKGVEAYVGAPLLDANGKPLGLIAVLFCQPLAEMALAENLLKIFAARASAEMERRGHLRSLEHQARHDPLTGLPNRVLLREMLEDGMRESAASKHRGALLLVDLDRFKEINDTLGHHVGDALLIRLSRRLAREMRSTVGGWVARLGGDEFAVWIGHLAHPGAEEVAAARALAAITAPLEIEGYRLEVGASIGIAIAPDHGDSPSGLLRCADVAMYDAKKHGSGYALYDSNHDPYSTERLALLTEMGTSIRNGEMEVHYQPRENLASGRLSGFEALARWRHPKLGMLAPARFVPLAELSDVIRPLTLHVLGTALRQRCAWGEVGRMAVNLSARHLLDDACPEQIARVIGESGAEPSMLEVEITESSLIADPERARATLERIRSLGVRIAIDDFGTGYSSLSHLKRLPLHALKIDVSFVRQMRSSVADAAIVDSTIGLAHQLGLSVAAEGIEDAATMDLLREHGCDEGQGFHIGYPMDAAKAEAWMRARH